MAVQQVIICGGASHPPLAQIKQILKNDSRSILIGVDRGCLFLLENNLVPSACFGDFDSVTEEERLIIEDQIQQVYKFDSEKDDTDLELALTWATQEFEKATFHLFGCFGSSVGRIDHLIANLWLVYQPRFVKYIESIRLYNEHNLIRFLGQGTHHVTNSEFFDYFSLIGMTPVKGLVIAGAKYELSATDYHYPKANISNEFIRSNVEIRLEEGLLMLVQSKDDNPINNKKK